MVVRAGRGTDRLARTTGLSLPVEHGAHVPLTFAVRGAAPRRLPTLQDSGGAFGETGVYAAATADNTAFAVGRAAGYVRRALPGLDPQPTDVRHCWVTRLPWGEDGLGVWERDGVLFPAGHNLFKQAPGLGRKLAATAVGEPLPDVLRPEVRLGAPPS